MTITLELRAQDAEPILREAARDAAKYGAWVDYFTRHTVRMPSGRSRYFDENRKGWNEDFLRAKRLVEAFGVEYEATGEAETLGVYIPEKVLKSHLINVGITMRVIDKSEPDPKNARPMYKSEVHAEACRQAAERVVRRWREIIAEAKAA